MRADIVHNTYPTNPVTPSFPNDCEIIKKYPIANIINAVTIIETKSLLLIFSTPFYQALY